MQLPKMETNLDVSKSALLAFGIQFQMRLVGICLRSKQVDKYCPTQPDFHDVSRGRHAWDVHFRGAKKPGTSGRRSINHG